MFELPSQVHILDQDVVMLDDKRDPTPCYFSHTIIQLVEVPPPPRRDVVDLESYASSSSGSESSSEDDPSSASYCSSDDAHDAPHDAATAYIDPSSATFSLRMKRILAWRENFDAHLSATITEPSLSSALKRKLHCDDTDTMSRSSKRSRSQSSSQGSGSLGALSCPACDGSFDSPQSLRDHGRVDGVNEACSVAVEYAFE